MANEIVRDIVQTNQAVTTTGDYQSPNGAGAILEGITSGLGTLIDYAQKGAARDAAKAEKQKETLDLLPGIEMAQEFAAKVSSTRMEPGQRQLEADLLVKNLTAMYNDAPAIKNIMSISGADKVFEVTKKFQTDAAQEAVSQDQFISDIADMYGIQGTAEERWAAGNELWAAKTSAYQQKQGLARMPATDQEKFVAANPQALRADIVSDMRAAIVQNGGIFTTQLLEDFKRAKTAELAGYMDLSLASKLVDYSLTNYTEIAKNQRAGIGNITDEIEAVQKLEASREWNNYLNSNHNMTINGKSVVMTGQQIEATKKAFGPEAWNHIIDQNMIQLAPFMSGLGTVKDLPPTSYKYFINGGLKNVLPGVTDGDALKNVQEGVAAGVAQVDENLKNLPRSVRNVDKISYAKTVGWLQGYDAFSKEQVDTAFKGREAEKGRQALVGAQGIAEGLNDRSNDYAFIQVEPDGRVKVFRNTALNRIFSNLKPSTYTGESRQAPKPVLEEITGEGRFIALGSYDALEAGQITDMALSVISNMVKFGMSPEEARKNFNRIQIEGSTAAQRFVNMTKDYEAGRNTWFSQGTREMSSADVKIIEDALDTANRTTASVVSDIAPKEGIDWGEAAIAATGTGALAMGLTDMYTRSQAETNRAYRQEIVDRVLGEPQRSEILRQNGITDPEAVVYENGSIRYTDAMGKSWETLPSSFNYRGNIDLQDRPVVDNGDGTVSTENSIVIEEDGEYIIIPTIVDGKSVSDKEAVEHYHKTGEHLGKYLTQTEAVNQSQEIHEQQARRLFVR